MSGLDAKLEAIRAGHAPDPRLEVWEVRVEDAGSGPRLVGATTSAAAVGDLRRLAAEAGLAFDVTTLPDPALGEAVRAVAHRSVAHLRARPAHAAELVSQMILGEEALVLRAEGPWLQVRTADGYLGWVHQGSLVRDVPEDDDRFRRRLRRGAPVAGAWIVSEPGVVARESPDPTSPPVADLVEGGRVALADPGRTGLSAGAIAIVLPDGTGGWIPAAAAVPAARLEERFTPSGRAVLDHGARFLGLPYLWGGTSEKGFDCSGFVQRIFGLHGAHLPRDADLQAAVGEPVEPGPRRAAVRDGDLAFFAFDGDRVDHVGILAAGGRILHCSTTRNGVAWDSLGEEGGAFGARLAAALTGIRRVAFPPAPDRLSG